LRRGPNDVITPSALWTLRGHKDHVTSVDWSPTAELTLASGGWDRRFRFWRFSEHEARNCRAEPTNCSTRVSPLWSGQHPQLVWRVAFAPGGHLIAACHGAVGQSPSVVLYDVSTGNIVRRIGRHRDTPLLVAWSADGKLLASAGMDRRVLVYDGTSTLDDLPRGDLDDDEERERWLRDLADMKNNITMQQNTSENQSTQFQPPHPLMGAGIGRGAYM